MDRAHEDDQRLLEDDERVPLARIVRESGMTAAEVRLALGEAGELVQISYGKDPRGKENRKIKLYPLKYTLALLQGGKGERETATEIQDDERVPLARLTQELGWATNTVKRYLLSAKPLVHTFPDPKDNRRRLYPLRYTVDLLHRVHGRLEARRLRSKQEGAAYWVNLAALKVATRHLHRLSSDIAVVARELEAALEGLRRTPTLTLAILTLPDPGLVLIHPLTVLVAPLRLVYWRATVPEIPLRGEAKTPEGAVLDLRTQLAQRYRELQQEPQPSSEPALWLVLHRIIRVSTPKKVKTKGQR